MFNSDYIRYTPQSLSIKNDKNKHVYNDIPRGDSDISMKDNYLE